LFSKTKMEESTIEKDISQNRHPKFKKVHTTPLYMVNIFVILFWINFIYLLEAALSLKIFFTNFPQNIL
jgi:preprotein translocase subunit Sec63